MVKVVFERADNGEHLLSISDDGEGFPAGFDPESGTGLGMKVVRMVARQLNGTLSVEQTCDLGGASIALRFPEPARAA
jgi:two-component sensor histidine kinase